MTGWDKIADVSSGVEMLFDEPKFWSEIRRAIFERTDAAGKLNSGSGATAIAKPLLVEQIYNSRAAIVGLSRGSAPFFFKEVAATAINADGRPPAWYFGAAVTDFSSLPLEAGLAQADWTQTGNPLLLYRSIWSDMMACLNKLVLVECVPAAFGQSGYSANRNGGDNAYHANFAATRAAAWANIPSGSENIPSPSGVGRHGLADAIGTNYRVRVSSVQTLDYSVDLSPLATVLHLKADGTTSACPPVRLVIYLRFPPQYVGTPPAESNFVDCPITLKWCGATVGTATVIVGAGATVKLVITDASTFTAGSVLRIEYAGTETADTPGWPTPTYSWPLSPPSDNPYYVENSGEPFMAFGVEFDWAFQA
jgi:hypothetical protein